MTRFRKLRIMGQFDRIMRFIFGSTLVYVSCFQSQLIDNSALNISVAIFGILNIISVVFRICPAYLLVNFSSAGKPLEEMSLNIPAKTDAGFWNFLITGEKSGFHGQTALHRKLLLSIALPFIGVLVLFGSVLYQMNERLGLAQQAETGDAAALIALQLTGRSAHPGDSVSPEEMQLLDNAMVNTELLVFSDTNGNLSESVYEKRGDNLLLLTALLDELSGIQMEEGKKSRGIMKFGESSFVHSTFLAPHSSATESNQLKVTSLTKMDERYSLIAAIFSPRFMVGLLIVLWFGLWSTVYVIRKFLQKMNESAQELEYRSTHDTLTGLPNRIKLDGIIINRIEEMGESDQALSLLVLDIVGFRDINDTLGYEMGDKLIVQISESFKDLDPDILDVVRMGGDIFTLTCKTGHDRANASRLANKIHDAVESHTEIEQVPLNLQAKIGMAIYPLDTQAAPELVRLADIALAQAKSERQKTVHYQHEKDSHTIRKLSLLARLRSAIEKDQLSLVYQPKLDIHSNEIVGVEALVRWVDNEYGPVSPIEFVTWAEKSGLIDKLTRWVLRTASDQAGEWKSRGLQMPIAVNLSPLNLHDPKLLKLVKELVTSGHLSDGLLELELTENAVMEDPARALDTMMILHGMGVPFAIDDFGTGLSSFTYLRKFPVSHLKIDRTFVMDPDNNDRDAVLLKSMIELGHSLGCVVTAEGVEDQPTLENLRGFGCDYVQGYHICKPMSGDDLALWIRQVDYQLVKHAA